MDRSIYLIFRKVGKFVFFIKHIKAKNVSALRELRSLDPQLRARPLDPHPLLIKNRRCRPTLQT